MLYSGYEINELNKIQKECFELSDIAIMGRYDEKLHDVALRWRGSTNQVLCSPTGAFDVNSLMTVKK